MSGSSRLGYFSRTAGALLRLLRKSLALFLRLLRCFGERPALLAEAEALGQGGALLGIGRCRHRIIARQAVTLAVRSRIETGTGEMALERLVGLSIDEAHEAVMGDRLADLSRGRLLHFNLGRFVRRARTDKTSVYGRNQIGQPAKGTELLDT